MGNDLYREMEKSYSKILYDHILAGKVIPHNDGVLTEVKVRTGGKGRRVDLLTRYKSPETYFAIEVKYWPDDFDNAFDQADQLVMNNEIDCAFVAVPAEYVSIANHKRSGHNQIGLLTISRLFQSDTPVEKATRASILSQNTRQWIAKHFDDPYYDEKMIRPKDRRYFKSIWKHIQDLFSPRIEIAFYTLYCAQQMYSYEKYCSYEDIKSLGNDICKNIGKSFKHVDWACDDLERVGLVEFADVEKGYYRLNPRFSYVMKNELDKWIANHGLSQWLNRKMLSLSNDRGKIISKFTK